MDEKQLKVLVVDDEPMNINLLVELLKPHYKVMAAKNGELALKAAKSTAPPDLVLLDIMMPEMDGYEVCRRLKEDIETKDIPVVFVTAMGETDDETKGLELGAVDYITKPISPPIVLARVKTHLALRQSMQALQKAYLVIESQKERMQNELNVGRDIQMSMLRQDFPVYSDRQEFDLAATILPAREVGGDFYDFFFVDQDRLCLCIGDVSGKGVPAALFMAVGKTLIKSRASSDDSPASIMTYVNDALCEGNESCMFITLFLAFLNVKTGELVYTNAGHNPPNIRKSSGEVTRLAERHGPVAGAMEGLAFKESRTRLEEGDALVLYTDGVTEAMNPNEELFEEHRLESLLASQTFTDSQSLNQAIITSVKDFEQDAGQADDITILSLIYNGDPDAGRGKRLDKSITNDLEQMPGFLDAFETFAEQTGLSPVVQSKVAMVFDELLNNTISYGYQDDDEHTIDIQVDVYPSYLSVVIRDDGVPFNPFTREDPNIELSIEDREIGGLGIHLVRNVMDEVSYERKVNQNVLTLVKRFKN